MIICICHNVSGGKIKEILSTTNDVHKLKDLKRYVKVCTQCGKCRDEVISMINENNNKIIPIKLVSDT